MAEPGSEITQSVTLLHRRFSGGRLLRDTAELFGEPRRTSVPTPHSAFIEGRSRERHLILGDSTHESTVAELFVFKNVKSANKLKIFVWTAKSADYPNILHYAVFLQVVEM